MYGPEKPPGNDHRNVTQIAACSESTRLSKRSYGPEAPPQQSKIYGPAKPMTADDYTSSNPPRTILATDSDDDDNDVGPLPAGVQNAAECARIAAAEERLMKLTSTDEPPKLRDDWMTTLPDSLLASMVGPLEPQERRFAKRSATHEAAFDEWTALPGDKAPAKKSTKRDSAHGQNSSGKRSREKTREMKKEGAGRRDESLLEQHQRHKKSEQQSKDGQRKPRVEFDRDRDLHIRKRTSTESVKRVGFLANKFASAETTSEFL